MYLWEKKFGQSFADVYFVFRILYKIYKVPCDGVQALFFSIFRLSPPLSPPLSPLLRLKDKVEGAEASYFTVLRA